MQPALPGALRLAFVLAVALPTLAYAEPSDLVPAKAGAQPPSAPANSRIIAIARAADDHP